MNKDELKALRGKLNLTQKAMGERLGISHSAVVKLESGENNMSKPVAMLAAKLSEELPAAD